MSTGLYPDVILVERFLASVSTGNQLQRFIAPTDLDVLGLALYVYTAPGAGGPVTVNISDSPTSQIGGGGTTVQPYNLWTSANVPTISGSTNTNVVVSQSNVFFGLQDLTANVAYALNYPLPGPSGTVGYQTAQSTSQTTQTPSTAPPVKYAYGISNLVAPDNTYTDYNGSTLTPASFVHAGDVLTFIVGGNIGTAADLEMCLYCSKR